MFRCRGIGHLSQRMLNPGLPSPLAPLPRCGRGGIGFVNAASLQDAGARSPLLRSRSAGSKGGWGKVWGDDPPVRSSWVSGRRQGQRYGGVISPPSLPQRGRRKRLVGKIIDARTRVFQHSPKNRILRTIIKSYQKPRFLITLTNQRSLSGCESWSLMNSTKN